ncbi:O-antigen ligase family protein [Terriglobus albidus]|uniref:O-antigen ligase family protein n=1 Tax=Terriglobus albidus TaxID=1592106 RepID=UPI0021E0E209|nr:hypothetical protein [Terriglobus albidus]
MLNALLAIVGIAIAIFYINQLVNNVAFGWASLLLTEWIDFTFGTSQSAVGGLNLSLPDVVSMCLLLAGAVRTLPRLKENNGARLIAFGYLSIFFFNYFRGVMIYGFPAASNEARGYVASLAGFLYFLTIPTDGETLKKFVRFFLVYVAGLFVTSVAAFAGLPVGSVAWAHGQSEEAINGRLLPSGAAGGVACGFIFGVAPSRWNKGTVSKFAPAIMFGLAIFLRHRTVWVMLIAALVTMVVVDRKMIRRVIPSLIVLGFLGGLASYFAPSDVSQEQSERITDATQDEGTFLWRLRSWEELVSDDSEGIVPILIGKPVGSGYWRFSPETGTYTTLPPHSEYVQEYLRVGAIGSMFLLLMFLRPLFHLWNYSRRIRNDGDSSPAIWCVIVVAIFAYGITYAIGPDLYALLAIGNAVAVGWRHADYSFLEEHGQLVLSS